MSTPGGSARHAQLAPAAVLSRLREWAAELGFSHLAVAHLDLGHDRDRLDAWLASGMHGSMAWLERHRDERADPGRLVPGTVSVISVRMDYMCETPDAALAALGDPRRAYVSRYALGRDYHKTLRGRLRQLARRLEAEIGPFGYRAFTDSAPLLERALARNAGLGWIGKHTNLIDRERGSLFFLGEILTAQDTQHHAEQFRAGGRVEPLERRLVALGHRRDQPYQFRRRQHLAVPHLVKQAIAHPLRTPPTTAAFCRGP